MDPVQSNFSIKKYIFLGLGIVLLLILWVWISNPMIVTVTGTGTVSVPATNATVSFTLSASDASIEKAVSLVQTKADTIRTYLRTNGIAEGDIAQTQITAVPAALVTQGATGFQATVSMAAKTTHVNDVSNVIEGLYKSGALVVSQPVLSVENQGQLDQQAFDSAMSDAKNQADKISSSNMKLFKKIVSISLASSASTSNSTTKADALMTANDSTAALNGVFKIAKAVSVSYKMW